MAIGIPLVFRRGGKSRISPTYDWYDFANGTAYKVFYLAAGKTSAGGSYFLTDTSNFGSASDTDVAGSTFLLRRDIAGTVDRDFDLTFTTPKTISGSAYISCRFTVQAGATASMKVTVYHVSAGAVETSLGSVTGPSRNNVAAMQVIECFAIPLTKKVFGVGESLRITIELTTEGSFAAIHHDPSGRVTVTDTLTGGTINSQFKVAIPFKVNL